ncbi:PLP-dependent aminotransferase family protein [Vibrio sp. DW001]|uniref:aminotransferase-like domain-containing protein n=1 Tax=Vibrio sp. DW001 TaxID=2912315 RepID=UPI0023AE9F16|nr:PLP-dependent aminotransferase family protein [Vibrio sp. DW001]WED26474.1 PLP-dependent aminotransferase family protein [Vibrio sp. DW001]
MTIIDFQLSDTNKTPKYKQIAERLAEQIEAGHLVANDKLPTHRLLADKLGVTVGTVTRAYSEAERKGLVEARVGAGTYVVDKKKAYWAFDQGDNYESNECNFGFNIPPMFDRSDMLKEAMEKVAQSPQALNQFMIYQKPTGIDSHREIVADWLNEHGVQLDAERLLFCSGAQHGMQMVFEAFTRAGDTILAEKLTYPGLISLAKQKQLTVKGIEMDEEGIIPHALEAACRQFQARFIYLTPTLQNPTTATMSLERRIAILDICKRHDLYVIEDDVNGLLPADAPPPMVNLAPEQVFHIGAFSKCLAPGLRVGYIQPPSKLHPHLSITLQNHSWMISPLLTALTCELLRSNKLEHTLDYIRTEMRGRLELALTYLSNFQLQYTHDCFHLWLTLPDHWRLSDFVQKAAYDGVIVKSAELFTPPAANVPPAVRLALSSPIDQDQVEAGLIKLKALLDSTPISDFTL